MSKKRVLLEEQMAGLMPTEAQDNGNVVALPAVAKTVNEKATVYLPKPALKRIKQMALDQDKRINDLLQEGIDLMLAKYGQPSIEEFGKR